MNPVANKNQPDSKDKEVSRSSASFVNDAQDNSSKTKSNLIQTPSVTLPKGGGALKSIDEKFSVNPVNGTAGFSIPLPFTPGRNGFTPMLALHYNSGSGNSIFGLGWDIDTASIQRKTDKKLPEYRDALESDTFIFSGVEDLVPVLSNPGDPPGITRYRPRIEGSFARIEKIETGKNTYWKVTSRDNVISVFGKSGETRLYNPVKGEEHKIFKWCLEYSYDDKGNCARYFYKKENFDKVAASVTEKNRLNNIAPFANIYLKKVKYGNAKAFYEGDNLPEDFLFELVFDYGEHHKDKPTTIEESKWDVRQDPFSDYKPGFEIRTYRICRRALMFHHFEQELGFKDYLVRAMALGYKEQPHLTVLESVTQSGFIWNKNGTLKSKRSFPPFEFTYSDAHFSRLVKNITPENIINAPIGLDNLQYQWIDLYSEGISGILTEQGSGWYYKENLGNGNFSTAHLVSPRPSFQGLTEGVVSIQELESNGKKFLVSSSRAVKGYFELGQQDEWKPFSTFDDFPNIDLRDPNIKFLDLNGDGMPDILISQEQEFIWHASKGKAGYDDAEIAARTRDEEKGPRILFSDKDEKLLVATADMNGDGLSDIVLITNEHVCYYPNLGYGRFGAKVTMKMKGCFDDCSTFDPSNIHLADIDGSGNTDIVYVGNGICQVWQNLNGNSLSEEPSVFFNPFPELDNYSRISFVDLLGKGTVCMVWSSTLPLHQQNPMRYIDMMEGNKPHIMIAYKNNLGKEVSFKYRSSAQYYLDDKKKSEKWITKLPFPVQCVSEVIIEDKISQTRFATKYSYHHGYYDSVEREFRGFARVEQRDSESFDHYVNEIQAGGGLQNIEKDLFQPAVITKTWFHTGAYIDHKKILHQLEEEYYPGSLIKQNKITDPEVKKILSKYNLQESPLVRMLEEAEAILNPLTTVEIIECHRALKGLPLRQEIYSEEGDENIQLHPYSAEQYNYEVRNIQRRMNGKPAVFLSHEKEKLAFHFERNPLDPRIAHSINVEIDTWGNICKSAALVYGRQSEGAELSDAADKAKQTKQYITFTKNSFTEIIDQPGAAYRLPLPCESETWEMDLPKLPLEIYRSKTIVEKFDAAIACAYEKKISLNEKRKIEHSRILFLKNDLSGPLQFGKMDTLGLAYENYLLAFTPVLAQDIYQDKFDENLWLNEAKYVRSENDNNYWIKSGKIFFHPDLRTNPNARTISAPTAADVNFAKSNFYLPVAYEDGFGNLAKVFYDTYKLTPAKIIDARDNEVNVDAINYRTLSPYQVRDANDNRTGVRFDEFGFVTHTFGMGKSNEFRGDHMDTLSMESSPVDKPGSVLEYQFRYFESNGKFPDLVKAKVRETHHYKQKQPAPGESIQDWLDELFAVNNNPEIENNIKWQETYSYSDGSGHEILRKIQAEPGLASERDAQGVLLSAALKDTSPALRWVGNGKTILNNKGNPVKQYKPYFDSSPEYNTELELTQVGATPLFFYDALGRLIKTKYPDGTLSRVEFNSWMQKNFDQNDAVKGSEWYDDRSNGGASAEEKEAAEKAFVHDNTPNEIYLDSLGRPFLTVVRNTEQRKNEAIKKSFYQTRSDLDIEGNIKSITDDRGNIVLSWKYDMLGNICYQHSMDGGDRWMLVDTMGKSLRLWDSRLQIFKYDYDELHRPLRLIVDTGTGDKIFEKFEYGEGQANAKQHNLRTKLYKHYDTAGTLTNVAFDFKGNNLANQRQLLSDYKNIPDWKNNPALEPEVFGSMTAYDALSRPLVMIAPDKTSFLPRYNEAGLLNNMDLKIKGAAAITSFVTNINYNEKGQREEIFYGNNTKTKYVYDPKTFRLKRLLTTANNGNQILQDLYYFYDPVGNITRQLDKAQKTIFYGGQKVDAQSEYTYDAAYRLIEASGREHGGQIGFNAEDNWADDWCRMKLQPNSPVQLRNYTQKYFYDAVGNIKKMQHIAGPTGDWTREYDYRQDNNQLIKTTVGNEEYDYKYNQHGGMISMPHLQQLQWNFREEMQQVDLGGGGKAFYVYDSSGQRSRKVIERAGNKIEERIYLGVFEIYRERTGNAITLERETLHVMDDKQRIAMIETRTEGNDGSQQQLIRYQYSNNLGSAGLELDEQGKIISYEEYHPYGTTAYQATDASRQVPKKRYRYTGMERDEETGLSYHSARYYIPWLGRWTSCDPKGLLDSQSLYVYVADNPVRYYDLTGNGLLDTIKSKASAAVDRVKASVQPGGEVFEAVDSAFKPSEHPVAAAVLNNMAKRGGDMVEGTTKEIKKAGEDFGDIAYAASHPTETGSAQKLNAAVQRRKQAPMKAVVGAVKGFAHQAKNVGEGLGTVAYYHPEFLGVPGLVLPSHSNEADADAKTASAVTDIALDAPQIVLTLEGGANLAKGAPAKLAAEGSLAELTDAEIEAAVSEIKSEGSLIELGEHGGASRNRSALGVSGAEVESAHLSPQSAMKGLEGYNPKVALTSLQKTAIHRSMDKFWRSRFQAMANAGQKTITAQKLFDMVSESFQRAEGLSFAEKSSLVARLKDELFVESGLTPNSNVRLPYSKK